MRPAGRSELDSLYFAYPHFAAPVQRAALSRPVRVLIVGAGPIGLTAALALARYGIGSVLLEAKASFNDGSRAICIARQSFHIFEAIGAIEPFMRKALPYLSGRSFFRGKQILQFMMPDSPDQKYRPMYNLEQQFTEQFLYEAVAREPLIEVRWQSRVSAVTQDEQAVRVRVEDAAGDYELATEWLLAADGARSTVRNLRGLRLRGENFEGRYVIADIRMRRQEQGSHRPVERLALFEPASRPNGTVLVHEQPEHIWRIDYQLRADEPEEEALKEPSIRKAVAGVLSDLGWDHPWDLEWWSIYSANTLALDDYRDDRIFYIGDSAHIVPIFGVRGLNNGLADAQNIAWKLAGVLNGNAAPDILNSYSPERRGATMDVFANASKSSRFMTPQTRGGALMRDAALLLALRHPFAGEFANPRNMTPYTYADSALVTPDSDTWVSGAAPGAVAGNVRLETGFLSDTFGPDFTLLCFGHVPGVTSQARLRVLSFPAEGAVAGTYGATDGTAYLIRPDMHVAARWRRARPEIIQAALMRAWGQDVAQTVPQNAPHTGALS
jgi:3-(3-hydroxy-phenyl)propionate hydroxylase